MCKPENRTNFIPSTDEFASGGDGSAVQEKKTVYLQDLRHRGYENHLTC